MKPNWITLRPRLLYGAFALLAFALALRWTFPSEAVRERLIYEAGARGWQIDVRDVGPSGLLGLRMDGVTLTDAAGTKIPIERLDASIRPLPLLIGKQVLSYDASIFDGSIDGSADLSGATRRAVVNLDGVNVKRILPLLRKPGGVDFAGVMSGRIDLTSPAAALEKATGTVDLTVAKAAVLGGNAVVPPFSNPMNIPPLGLGTFTMSGKADTGRVALDKLEFRGGDAELAGEGVVVVLQPKMEYAPVVGKLKLRFAPTIWQKPATAPMRPMIEAALMNAKGPDGSYQYQVFGNLGAPQLRPLGAGGGGPPTAQ